MKSWCVLWATREGRENFVILPSYWKVLLWFLRNAHRCNDIKIFTS